MTEAEYLELLTLSAVILPNIDSREYNVKAAAERQMELFRKATQQYSWYQDAEVVTTE